MLSQIEPKKFEEANKDKNQVNAMNEELDQIEKQNLGINSKTHWEKFHWHKMDIQE